MLCPVGVLRLDEIQMKVRRWIAGVGLLGAAKVPASGKLQGDAENESKDVLAVDESSVHLHHTSLSFVHLLEMDG